MPKSIRNKSRKISPLFDSVVMNPQNIHEHCLSNDKQKTTSIGNNGVVFCVLLYYLAPMDGIVMISSTIIKVRLIEQLISVMQQVFLQKNNLGMTFLINTG